MGTREVPFPPEQELHSLRRQVARNEADLEKLRRAEQALRQNQQMLRLMMDNVPQMIFWKDRTLTYRGCNAATARAAGLSGPEDILCKTDFDLCWKASAETYRRADLQVIESGLPRLNIEETCEFADGRTVWFNTNKVPLLDDGEVVGVLCTCEDITDQHHARAAVAESEKRYRVLFDNSPGAA
jgi:PAS domain S-box-containing protein